MSTLGGRVRTLRRLVTGLVLAIGVLTVADVALGASGPAVSRRARLVGAAGLVVLGALVAVERGDDSGDGTEGSSSDGDEPSVGDHYRATDGEWQVGAVYRVVGSDGDATLLRVTDAEGRRRHTGDLASVPAGEFERAFEAASDPDAGFSPVRALRNQLQGLYWSVRRFF